MVSKASKQQESGQLDVEQLVKRGSSSLGTALGALDAYIAAAASELASTDVSMAEKLADHMAQLGVRVAQIVAELRKITAEERRRTAELTLRSISDWVKRAPKADLDQLRRELEVVGRRAGGRGVFG